MSTPPFPVISTPSNMLNFPTTSSTSAQAARPYFSAPSTPVFDHSNASTHRSLLTDGDTAAPRFKSADLEDNLLSEMHHLFVKISSLKKKTGAVVPTNFISKVKNDNGKQQPTSHIAPVWIMNVIS
jgi:hypothetical protein